MTATQGTESRTRQSETAAEVVGRLRATFNTGVTRGLDWRVDQLQRLRALLVENEQELIEALWADLRKNAAEAKTQEIDFTVADIDETLASLESWLQPRPVEVPAHFGPTTTAYTTYDPLGVVLVIAPWNFPLHLLIDPIIGALAAGNTVVAKPSEISVHTSASSLRPPGRGRPMRRMCQSRSKSGSLIQCGRPRLSGGSTSFHRSGGRRWSRSASDCLKRSRL